MSKGKPYTLQTHIESLTCSLCDADVYASGIKIGKYIVCKDCIAQVKEASKDFHLSEKDALKLLLQ